MDKILNKLTLLTLSIILSIFRLEAQWSGTSPERTSTDVGIGNIVIGSGATAIIGRISTPLGQLHISQIRPSFTPLMPPPVPHIFLTSYCEGEGEAIGSPPVTYSTNYSIESDCYDGYLKFNSINSTTGNVGNILSMNPTKVVSQVSAEIKDDLDVTNDITSGSITSANSSLGVANASSITSNEVTSNGNITINNGYLLITGNNTSTTGTNEIKLSSNGYIRAREVKVDYSSIPDYVFKTGYKLMSIYELEKFITINKHLPNIKSENEYSHEEGISIGELNTKMLEKVEELTLYIIQQQKELDKLKKLVNSLVKE